MFFNKEVNKAGVGVIEKGKKILEKITWPAKKIILAALASSTLAPGFKASAQEQADSQFVQSKNKIELAQMGTAEKQNEKQIDQKREQNKKILEDCISRFTKNKRLYIKNPQEFEGAIMGSLDRFKGEFQNEIELRNAVESAYGLKLSPSQVEDFYQFIEKGHGADEKLSVKENTIKWQTILAEMSKTEHDSPNKNNIDILKSNANAKYKDGIDGYCGLKTLEASFNNLEILRVFLEKIKANNPGLIDEVNKIKTLGSNEFMGREEVLEDPQVKKFGVGFEQNFSFSNEQIKEIDEFIPKLNFDVTSLDNLADYLKQFESSKFDKILVDGVEHDFDYINDTGVGEHTIIGGGFIATYNYSERTEGGKQKTIENFNIKLISEPGENTPAGEENKYNLSFSCGKVSKDYTKEGDFAFDMEDVKVNLFGAEIGFEKLSKTDSDLEFKNGIKNVSANIGGWKLDVDSVGFSYDKDPNYKGDVIELLNKIWKGQDGMKLDYLIDRISVTGGAFTLTNNEGVTIKGDGNGGIFYNDALIFRDENGNFNIQNIKSGDGMRFNGGASSFAEINGEKMTGGEFINKIVNGGAEAMIDSPETKLGVSALGGALSVETDINSHFTEEILNNCGAEIDKKFQDMADEFESFSKSLEGKSTEELINKAVWLKKEIVKDATELINTIVEKGDIKMEDYKFTLDFKKLSDNFELIGHQDEKNNLYGVDVLLAALGNDLGVVMIDKNTVEEYKNSANKEDYIVKKMGWGNSMKEAVDSFKNRMTKEMGEDITRLSAQETFDVINSINNGEVAGVTLSSENQVRGFFKLAEKVGETTGHNFSVIGTGNFGLGNGQNSFAKAFNTAGEEHIGVDINTKSVGGAGLILVKGLFEKDGTKVNAFADVGAEFIKGDFNIAVNDGKFNTYKSISLETALRMAKGETDYMAELDRIKGGVILPHASIGVNAEKDFVVDGREYGLGGNVSVSGIPGIPTLFVNYEVSGEAKPFADTEIAVSASVGGNLNLEKGAKQEIGGKVSLKVPIKYGKKAAYRQAMKKYNR